MSSVTDPIADFLTRIRNGLQADHDAVVMPASKLKMEMARVLSEQGYIEEYANEPARVGQALRVRLKYTEDRAPVISGMKRVSNPGRRTLYVVVPSSWIRWPLFVTTSRLLFDAIWSVLAFIR